MRVCPVSVNAHRIDNLWSIQPHISISASRTESLPYKTRVSLHDNFSGQYPCEHLVSGSNFHWV